MWASQDFIRVQTRLGSILLIQSLVLGTTIKVMHDSIRSQETLDLCQDLRTANMVGSRG